MLSTRDVIRVDRMSTYVEESFTRDTDYIADRITADGGGDWPVAPGRYRLVVARACPWAHRSIIVRGAGHLDGGVRADARRAFVDVRPRP